MSSIRQFESAVRALDRRPPSFLLDHERQQAFLAIGHFFDTAVRQGKRHDLQEHPNRVWATIAERLVDAVAHIEDQTVVSNGVALWQMYNSGIIVCADEVVLGFDVVPTIRAFGWEEPAGFTERLAGLLDVLCITHRHTDHYDRELVRACAALGKPVVLPPSLAAQWEPTPGIHAADHECVLEFNDTRILARKAFHVWRDDIDDVPLAYYEVTCRNGCTLMITGDADYTKEFEKSPDTEIDLLCLPWRNPNAFYEDGKPEQIGRTLDAVEIAIERIKPARVLLEHYGELEHIYGGFSPSYNIAVGLQNDLPIPCELLFWGESVRLR